MKLIISLLLLGIALPTIWSKSVVKRDNCCCDNYSSCSSPCTVPCNSGYSNCNNRPCNSGYNNCNNRPCSSNRPTCNQGSPCNHKEDDYDDDDDDKTVPILIPFPQPSQGQPGGANTINNTNINNGTLEFTLTNLVNTVNNISVPINLNSTNTNTISLYLGIDEGTSTIVEPDVGEINKRDNCCQVVYEKCDKNNKCSTEVRTECSEICRGIFVTETIPPGYTTTTPRPIQPTLPPRNNTGGIIYVIYPPVKPPVYPPINPPVYPPINPPVYPPINPPVYPPIIPPVYPPIIPSPCGGQPQSPCSSQTSLIQQPIVIPTYPNIQIKPSCPYQQQTPCSQQQRLIIPTYPDVQIRPACPYQNIPTDIPTIGCGSSPTGCPFQTEQIQYPSMECSISHGQTYTPPIKYVTYEGQPFFQKLIGPTPLVQNQPVRGQFLQPQPLPVQGRVVQGQMPVQQQLPQGYRVIAMPSMKK